MPLLNASLQTQLREFFGALPRNVTLLVFVKTRDQEAPCETCQETRELAEELASLSDGKIRVEIRDLYRVAAERKLQIRRLDYKRDSLEDIFLKAMEGGGNGRV